MAIPAAIFCGNRPDHTERLLASLYRCQDIDQLSVHDFFDSAHDDEDQPLVEGPQRRGVDCDLPAIILEDGAWNSPRSAAASSSRPSVALRTPHNSCGSLLGPTRCHRAPIATACDATKPGPRAKENASGITSRTTPPAFSNASRHAGASLTTLSAVPTVSRVCSPTKHVAPPVAGRFAGTPVSFSATATASTLAKPCDRRGDPMDPFASELAAGPVPLPQNVPAEPAENRDHIAAFYRGFRRATVDSKISDLLRRLKRH